MCVCVWGGGGTVLGAAVYIVFILSMVKLKLKLKSFYFAESNKEVVLCLMQININTHILY